MSYLPIQGGTGGGILYPDSAARPFSSNSARNNWANNNKQDLIKDTTVVNVGGNQWYLWTGESNPDTVNNSLWMDADQIVPGEKGDQGDPGIDVTTAVVNTDGDLIVTLSNGNDINAGRARGEDGDLVYQLLPMADYGNFFDADWGTLGTNIYGLAGDGANFANGPFPTTAGQEYSFEILVVNEPNQYSLRVTLMEAGTNSGRDAILAGKTKTDAESAGWKVYAFTSDPGHADPTEGFDLQPDADIGLDSTSALTIKNNAGDVHNVVDQDINLDAIRLGSPAMKTYLRTNEERMQVQTANGMKDIAHLEDIPSPTNPEAPARFAYWVREDEYVISEEEIQQEVMLMIQPTNVVGDDRLTTITFPSQAAFTNHYHVPGVNDADAGTKPHIESFRFSIWLYYYTQESRPVKVIMNSTGNWLPFVSSESLSETNGVYLYKSDVRSGKTELHTFAFMRPINYNPAVGLNGWSFQNVHPYDWIPLNEQPPAQAPVSTLGDVMVDNNQSSHIRTDESITSDHDPATGETTLSAVPMSVEGEPTTSMVMGAGITAEHDPLTNTSTLTVDPTNIDLSGYAELDTDVSFAEVTAKSTIIAPERDQINSISSLQIRDGDGQVLLGSVIQEEGSVTPDFVAYIGDTEQSGSIQNLESVNSKFEDGRVYGFGTGAILSVSQTVIDSRRRYIIGATAPDTMTLTISDDLEGCRLLLESLGSEDTNFTTITVSATGRQNLVFDIGRHDKWIVEFNKGADANAYRVKNGAEVTALGLVDRTLEIKEPAVRPFQYAEGMPYHLLLETPTSSRLFHEFPRSKTHRFTPIDSNRKYEGVTLNTSNEQGPTDLGQYSDLPLYTFEPNIVINRDQVGYINFPADMTIDTSQGFYFFGTVSGWAGGAQNNGTTAVYVGTNADNPKAGGSKIGFALTADRLVILTGNDAQDAVSATASRFNLTNGVANFYRFAVYVDLTGMMTYYIVSLNNRVLHTGQQQCDLSTVSNNPKLWVAYDREAANTSTIAVGEIHLVLETEGEAEQMWNWRN